MNFNTSITSIILLVVTISAHSQFYIDGYYGSNHSNETFTLPDDFNDFVRNRYAGVPIDTSYFELEDSTVMILIREDLGADYTEQVNKHNFYTNQLLGVAIGYEMNDYLKVHFAYDYINLSDTIKFVGEGVSCLYKEGELTSRSVYFDELKYNFQKLSLGIAIKYPLKKLEPELYVSADTYYTKIKHNHWSQSFNYERNIVWGKTYEKWEYSGFGYGFTAGFGMSYNVYKNVSVFGKVGYTKGTLMLTKGTVLESFWVDPTPAELEEYEIPFNRIPYSGYNFKIGVRYKFLKHAKSQY
ncbi:MAG: hypothetical protein PF448_00525 [Bacteroidales bacterium]|jgi:hypothetical protein|nr:hypothetical protein [Bacteroidales bacterium]